MKWQYLCLVSVLSFALAGVEAVLLRIRLSNGQVIRHEAEGAEGEGKLNINQFRQDMLAKGHIVSLNPAKYNCKIDAVQNDISAKKLSAADKQQCEVYA